jgi:hypothetical protein
MLKNSTWSQYKFHCCSTYTYHVLILHPAELEDTNLANFGSKLDLDHHKQEGALETAWNYAGSRVGKAT